MSMNVCICTHICVYTHMFAFTHAFVDMYVWILEYSTHASAARSWYLWLRRHLQGVGGYSSVVTRLGRFEGAWRFRVVGTRP